MKTWRGLLVVGMVVILSACGGSSATTDTSTGTGTASCAAGDNDYYVVENAECAANSGKLTRINPDATDGPCSEEILPGLDCPVDFIFSSQTNIGYLSVRTTNTGNTPGEIYQVNVSAKTKTLIFDGLIVPGGLAILENLTSAEQDSYCGGNALQSALLFIADEGTDEGGLVRYSCLNLDTPAADSSLLQSLATFAEGFENPRGVALNGRTEVVFTAHTTGDTGGLLLRKEIDSTGSATVVSTIFTVDVKDLSVDSGSTFLICDAGDDTVTRMDIDNADASTSLSGFNGARDIVSDGNDQYLVSLFDDNAVGVTTLVAGSDILNASTDLTLAEPDGIALHQ